MPKGALSGPIYRVSLANFLPYKVQDAICLLRQESGIVHEICLQNLCAAYKHLNYTYDGGTWP